MSELEQEVRKVMDRALLKERRREWRRQRVEGGFILGLVLLSMFFAVVGAFVTCREIWRWFT